MESLSPLKLYGLFTHHDLGNDVEHLLVAAATARGAVGLLLDLLKGGDHVIKPLVCIKRIGDLSVADLHTVTDHVIFLHSGSPYRELAEVSLEQALECLAVTCLVACHFVYGIVNGIKI